MIGQLVGHYRILEKIGAGAMGEVFRARDERLGREVALKLIRPASSDNPDHLRRFELEARAAAALNHPNILAIYDVGFEGATPYIVSELLQGATLRQRLASGSIPVSAATDYALQIAHGLTAAHERHIVHRDLKPENLFLTDEGRVKILDFGVAKLQTPAKDNRNIENLTTVTKSGSVIGTVAYMSPEQLRARPVDHRSDIFSFGAILYEMLSGSRAFRGETEVDTMTAVLREEPADTKLDEATVPAAYRDIIRHCLEKEPGERFQSAKDLAFALQTLSSSPIRQGSLGRARTRAPQTLLWSIAGLLIATLLAVAFMMLRPGPASPSYRRLTFEAGTIYSARFAPDGQSVVYSASWNNNPAQIFSTVGNSLLAQPLNLSDANLLAVSRNNELALVMHGSQNGQLEMVDGVLARAPMAGGAPREVLPGVRWADWDMEGKLAVVRDVDGHSRLEYPIGNVLYQSGGWISNPRFAPNYDLIAFMDHATLWDNRGTVDVVDLSGHVRTLGGDWESEHGIAWRPDGKEIWFTAIEKGHDLNLMAVDLSGKVRLVLNLPVGITLQDIASDARVLVTLNSKRLAMASSTLGGKEDTDLSWHDWNNARDISLDDQFVLFEDASEAAGPGYSVAVRKIDGTLPVRLGDGSSGGFSPDGKWALSISTKLAPQVTLLPIGPGQPRTINVKGPEHIHNGWARFLPNGQQFAVNGDKTSNGSRCYVVDLTSGEANAVTPDGVFCGPFSPDSRSLVGVGPNRSVALYSLSGGPPRQIPNLSANFHPVQWSNDGFQLYGYHVGEFPSKIYKVEIATGKETVVQELKPGASAGVVTVAPIVVSRDGTRFAYSYNQTLSTLYLISGLH
jgi:eukaryotic-like serine/threonine-protein kinase